MDTRQISPILNLPAEILMDIFSWDHLTVSRHKFDYYGHEFVLNQFKRSILMSHICQRWRAVAIGDVLLWQDLPLHLQHHSQNRLDEIEDMMSELFRRSNGLGVRLYLNFDCVDPKTIQYFINHCRPWLTRPTKKLVIKISHVNSELFTDLLLSSPTETLEIQGDNPVLMANLFSPVVLAILQNKKVKELSLLDVGEIVLPSEVVSTQLIELSLSGTTHGILFAHIPIKFPNLKTLNVINGFEFNTEDETNRGIPSVTISSLHSLDVWSYFATDLTFWNIRPDLPNLTSLTIRDTSLSSPDLVEHICQMLSLTELDLGGGWGEQDPNHWTDLALRKTTLTKISGH